MTKLNPETAISFITDSKGNKTHVILPMELYKDILALKELITSASDLQEDAEVYTLTSKNIISLGYPMADRRNPSFMVLKGSKASLTIVQSLRQPIIDLRNELINSLVLTKDTSENCYIFTKNYLFSSPSMAASLIAGNSANGLEKWINKNGFTLKDSGYGLKHS